jgi:hypothetical protein
VRKETLGLRVSGDVFRSAKNEKMGHDSAMSDDMREVMPHGCHMVKGVTIGQ